MKIKPIRSQINCWHRGNLLQQTSVLHSERQRTYSRGGGRISHTALLAQGVFKQIADKSLKRLLAKCTDNPTLLHRKWGFLKNRLHFGHCFHEKIKGFCSWVRAARCSGCMQGRGNCPKRVGQENPCHPMGADGLLSCPQPPRCIPLPDRGVPNPGINLLAEGIRVKPTRWGWIQSPCPVGTPLWVSIQRVGSLPVAPHAVEHQDHSAQAVTGGVWRAADPAERSRFVLPSRHLKRQKERKGVVGGTQQG